MDVAYINPFLEASKKVFGEFGITFGTGKLHLKDEPQLEGKITIVIGVTGKLRGQVFFNMHEHVALGIAAKMMGVDSLTGFDEISKSAIAEMYNMVLGNTATIFSSRGLLIDITPPTTLFGEHIIVNSSKGKVICIPLELSIGGVVAIDLALSDDKNDHHE